MTSGVYGIYCTATGVCLYVGRSISLEGRQKSHLKTLKNGSHPRKAFVKWFQEKNSSPEAMDFRVLAEEEDSSKLNALEIQWFLSEEPLFFGKRPSTKERWTQSEETRKRISVGLERTRLADPEATYHTLRDKVCLNCKEDFPFKKKRRNSFCSRECFSAYRIANPSAGYDSKQVLKDYASGMTLAEVGALHGVSGVTVWNVLRRNGVTPRDRGARSKKK